MAYLIFPQDYLQLSLGMLSDNVEQYPSFLQVSCQVCVLQASIELASSSFELHIGCLFFLSFLQALILLTFKLPLILLRAFLWAPFKLTFSFFQAQLEFALTPFELPLILASELLQAFLKLLLGLLCISFRLLSGSLSASSNFDCIPQFASNLLFACFTIPSSFLCASLAFVLSLLSACFQFRSSKP